jgi:hypothetical protein
MGALNYGREQEIIDNEHLNLFFHKGFLGI